MAIQYSAILSGTCGSNFYGSVTLTFSNGNAPYIVDWQKPSLGVDSVTSSSTRTGLVAETYNIYVYDNSSPTPQTLNIVLPLKDNVCCSIDNITNTTCNQTNGSVVVSSNSIGSVSGFYLYNFNGELVQFDNTIAQSTTFYNLSSGTYYIVSTNNFGCSGQSETFIIGPSNELNFGLYSVPNATCGIGNLGKIMVTGITGTAPFTYNWTNGETGSTITGLTEGVYSVEVTDALGCSKIQSATVESVDPLGLILITPTSPTCLQNNGSLTFQFTGGTAPFYYQASNGFYDVSYLNTVTLQNIGAGTYTLTVTDAALCTISASTRLASPSGMSFVNVNVSNSQCSSNNGSLEVFTEGGNPPYTYTIVYPTAETKQSTTNSTNYLFSNLSGGSYTIVLNDSSGCTFTNDYIVVTQSAFSIETSSTGSTFGQSNGFIRTTKTSGGTAPYEYSLDGRAIYKNTTADEVTFFGVSSGQHEVRVSDSNGCFEINQVTVDAQPIVDFFLNLTSDGTESGNTLTALISGGKPPFTFIWSENVPNNPQQITATGLTAGTYSLTVVDSNKSEMMQTKIIPGGRSLVSYGVYTVGQQEFQRVENTKYSLSKMMNEGFQDITSGNTGCVLNTATFTAEVLVYPFGTLTTQQFFVSNSLLAPPPDNLWYDAIKNLVSEVIGVKEVIINESNNTITIVSDPSRSDIVDGTSTAINIKINLIIDYDIYCSG